MWSNGVNGSYYGDFNQTEQTSQNEGTSRMGKDDFLKLLVTQLKYQDPLKPMEDKEFIAQTAQFSSLEQMQNINNNFSQFMKMQAVSNTSNLIGKEVTYLISASDDEAAQYLSGKVTGVKFEDGVSYMTVNGEDVPLDNLAGISEADGDTENGETEGTEGETETETEES